MNSFLQLFGCLVFTPQEKTPIFQYSLKQLLSLYRKKTQHLYGTDDSKVLNKPLENPDLEFVVESFLLYQVGLVAALPRPGQSTRRFVLFERPHSKLGGEKLTLSGAAIRLTAKISTWTLKLV